MGEPWIDHNWTGFGWDLVLNHRFIAAVAKYELGVSVYLAGSGRSEPFVIPTSGQAENIWADISSRNPIDDGWLKVNDRLCVNVAHLCGIERESRIIRLYLNSVAGPVFSIQSDEGGDELYGMFFTGADKTLIYTDEQE